MGAADFLPRQAHASPNKPLLHWLIRRVEVTRGRVPLRVEIAPAFNYARDPHKASVCHHIDLSPLFQKIT